jgi:hypothetical protein
MLAAVQGKSQQALDLFNEFKQDPEASDFWDIIVYAWLGDKEKASAIAAEIDDHPYGPGSLSTMIYWCACGLPWDMESTPIFAKKVKESGLPWPPVSPIKFPLKDW